MPFAPGFDTAEALDLLALSAYSETEQPEPPIPDPRARWSLLFDSPQIGPFENKWQLWQRAAGDRRFAIALRGTVPEAGSIVEDLIALMIEASGTIAVGGNSVRYRFARDPRAPSAKPGVHLGFALGTLLLLLDPANGIIAQLPRCGVAAGSEIYVTGHSQGAAMATLLRSYLHYQGGAPANCTYKTYVFAQPKPGNDQYAADFESRFSNSGLAFRVTNSLDWVPQVPFTLEFIGDINEPNLVSAWFNSSARLIALKSILDGAESVLSGGQHILENHLRDRFEPALRQLVSPGAAPGTAAGAALALMPSFNFVNAGSEYALIGNACSGAQCDDGFFEHHCTTYYGLMTSPPPP